MVIRRTLQARLLTFPQRRWGSPDLSFQLPPAPPPGIYMPFFPNCMGS